MDVVKRDYVNIIHDVSVTPLPLRDNEYHLIYMSHILEHVPWYDTINVLMEIRRCLKPGGRAEVWVPDLAKLISGYFNPDIIEDKWRKHNPDNDSNIWFNGRLFAYGPEAENWHRAAFDASHLKTCFIKAGFSKTAMLKTPRGYDHGWINLGMVGIK